MARRRKEEIENVVENKPEVIDYNSLMEQFYIDYSLSVIIDRAIPDIKDGLKPVQRRVLYDMYELSLYHDKPHKKCARIVGDTMGKYHPHGDSSIYGALVNMAQSWKNNVCLVDGHGNFGSIDGDGSAAMRYTEARLSKIGELMLEDLNNAIVPFVDNFDANEKEPTYLPSKLPILFINGIEGIAVGMKTYIPPHNLGELIDATLFLIKNPKATITDLMKFVKGPDYPTGGTVINKKELKELYTTGSGKVKIRGKVEIEKVGNDKSNIIITEIPYTLSGRKPALISSIVDLMKANKLSEVTEIRDESSEETRIVIEVKKGQDIDKLLNKLYLKTKLQDNETCNFLVIDIDGVTPKVVNLKDYLQTFISVQETITHKKYQLLLNKAKERLEIVEGLLKANDIVDAIIETIRYAKNVQTAKKCLISGDTTNINYKLKKNQTIASKFDFTENQAQVILDMRLAKLNKLEISSFEKEMKDLLSKINAYEKILKSKTLLDKKIMEYLEEIKQEFATKRKTNIIDIDNNNIVVEDEIQEEEVKVIIDRFGYLKVVDNNSLARSTDDTIKSFKHIISILNTDKLAIFTDK